jgi:hypothetical protein
MDPSKKELALSDLLECKRKLLGNLPRSRERSLIITKLDEAALWLSAIQIKKGEECLHHQVYLERG